MKVYLEPQALPIDRAHETDAGIDLKSPIDTDIPPRSSAVIDTGVHVEIPYRCAGLLVSKSGLNVKHGILSTGLIDEGYTGSITVKLYNDSDEEYQVKRGDKITQLVIMPIERVGLFYVSSLAEFGYTERGARGFGSTGRQ